jgi:hypothetical protein
MSEHFSTTNSLPVPTQNDNSNDPIFTHVQGASGVSITGILGLCSMDLNFTSGVNVTVKSVPPPWAITAGPDSSQQAEAMTANSLAITKDAVTRGKRSTQGDFDSTSVRPRTIPATFVDKNTWQSVSNNRSSPGQTYLDDLKPPDATADFVVIENPPESGKKELRAFVDFEGAYNDDGYVKRTREPLESLGPVIYDIIDTREGEILFAGVSQNPTRQTFRTLHKGPAVTSIVQPKGTAARLGLRPKPESSFA